jgi:hypothetical protein
MLPIHSSIQPFPNSFIHEEETDSSPIEEIVRGSAKLATTFFVTTIDHLNHFSLELTSRIARSTIAPPSQLRIACNEQNISRVGKLLKNTKVDTNEANDFCPTLLSLAIQLQNPELFQLLLSHPQIDINAHCNSGMTALAQACYLREDNYFEALLNRPEIKIDCDFRFFSPVYIVVNLGDYRKLTLLLEHPKTDQNLVYQELNHFLFLALNQKKEKHLRCAQLLLSLASLNQKEVSLRSKDKTVLRQLHRILIISPRLKNNPLGDFYRWSWFRSHSEEFFVSGSNDFPEPYSTPVDLRMNLNYGSLTNYFRRNALDTPELQELKQQWLRSTSELRIRINGPKGATIFFLLKFYEEGYLSLSLSSTPSQCRFFSIAAQLNGDCQEILCSYLYGLSNPLVSAKVKAQSYQNITKDLLLQQKLADDIYFSSAVTQLLS